MKPTANPIGGQPDASAVAGIQRLAPTAVPAKAPAFQENRFDVAEFIFLSANDRAHSGRATDARQYNSACARHRVQHGGSVRVDPRSRSALRVKALQECLDLRIFGLPVRAALLAHPV